MRTCKIYENLHDWYARMVYCCLVINKPWAFVLKSTCRGWVRNKVGQGEHTLKDYGIS